MSAKDRFGHVVADMALSSLGVAPEALDEDGPPEILDLFSQASGPTMKAERVASNGEDDKMAPPKKKETRGRKSNGTSQRSLRLPVLAWAQFDDVANDYNAVRDGLTGSLYTVRIVIDVAVRDLLAKHSRTGAYPPGPEVIQLPPRVKKTTRRELLSGTSQRSIRLPKKAWAQLEEIAGELNGGRDPLADSHYDVSLLLNMAFRDVLAKHGRTDAYPQPRVKKAA